MREVVSEESEGGSEGGVREVVRALIMTLYTTVTLRCHNQEHYDIVDYIIIMVMSCIQFCSSI